MALCKWGEVTNRGTLLLLTRKDTAMSGPPLTLEERYLIHAGFVGQLSVAQMAHDLRRHRSVIYDEYQRGRDAAGHYCPHRGQRYRDAASARSAANVIGKPEQVWREVKVQIKQGWSPEQISGRRALLGEADTVSIQGIYGAAERHGWGKWLHTARVRKHLKRPARRKWNGSAPSIHARDKDVALRIHIGDWEADTAVGKKKDKRRLLVMVERQSLYLQLAPLNQIGAALTARVMKRRLDTCGIPFNSVATDRGTEFRATGEVMPGKAFVCDPHAPNQRGTNENQIGMLRADLPKGASMENLTPAKCRRLEEKYNHRPRKCLGFLTPYEVAFNRQPRVGTRT
jgi:IS30 family transposase